MKKLSALLILSLFVLSCDNKNSTKADYCIELSKSSNVDGNWVNSKQAMLLEGDMGWIAFDHVFSEAGRYKVEIEAKGEGVVWLEDYFSNKDGRTYNVTGDIIISANGNDHFYKDGSPFNKGNHDFKLHVTGKGISIQRVLFTKMTDHEITPVSMEQGTEGDEWQLVWSDEFEGQGLPDTLKWTYDIGNWGWGNNEPQYYTRNRLENARLENGNLIIEARKNDFDQPWTSARLTTRSKVSFLYGKIEFRAKVPSADGTWAAGWLLGDAYIDELSWPYIGEIDVLECVGNEIDDETGSGINHASCHTRTYYFKEGTQITATSQVENMANAFHSYSIEWSPEGILGFVDGEHYFTYDKTADKLEWPFNEPQNIILNLAMGGGMGGAIDPELSKAEFIIDYVRVYGRK